MKQASGNTAVKKTGHAMLPQENFLLYHEKAVQKRAATQEYRGYPCTETLQVQCMTPPYGRRMSSLDVSFNFQPASRVILGSLRVKTCDQTKIDLFGNPKAILPTLTKNSDFGRIGKIFGGF
ncbi:MAG: hypothetical protein FWC43_12640 [Planctomycetaceae bacterium]|nr:hypothetical protein [Planctomycetaceae bacterium]